METITFEDKINFLDDLLKRAKLLNETCEACMPQKNISIIECLIEDVNYLHATACNLSELKKFVKSSDGDIEKEMFYNDTK